MTATMALTLRCQYCDAEFQAPNRRSRRCPECRRKRWTERWHGTLAGYNRHACRCKKCKAASRAYHKARNGNGKPDRAASRLTRARVEPARNGSDPSKRPVPAQQKADARAAYNGSYTARERQPWIAPPSECPLCAGELEPVWVRARNGGHDNADECVGCGAGVLYFRPYQAWPPA